jgi:hypothetical protein
MLIEVFLAVQGTAYYHLVGRVQSPPSIRVPFGLAVFYK